jgi:hypothetical protein
MVSATVSSIEAVAAPLPLPDAAPFMVPEPSSPPAPMPKPRQGDQGIALDDNRFVHHGLGVEHALHLAHGGL